MIDADDVVERFMSGPRTEYMAERREFLDWAFGADYDFFDIKQMNYWNDRHSELVRLYPNDDPIKSLPALIRLWVESKKNPDGKTAGENQNTRDS